MCIWSRGYVWILREVHLQPFPKQHCSLYRQIIIIGKSVNRQINEMLLFQMIIGFRKRH